MMNSRILKPIAVSAVVMVIIVLHWGGVGGDTAKASVYARSKESNPEPLPPSPLEITTPDPLLPEPPENGFVRSPQREILIAALDELNIQAAAQLAAGNTKEAFEIWNRELRLRRYLGPLDELSALTRVGTIAWFKEQITQVQIIAKRVETIQETYCSFLTPNFEGESSVSESEQVQICNLDMLNALGKAYEAVRERDLAVVVYQAILADARQRGDLSAQEALLLKISQLHLDELDYVKAAESYEQLLALSIQQGDRLKETTYIQELAYIYSQARLREKAIAMRQRLIDFYVGTQDVRTVPELYLEIATDYQVLGQIERALQNLKQGYTLAWTLQQFYQARKALSEMASIYRSVNQLDEALQVYQALLIVDQRAYNLLGMMNTYDQIGQLHQSRQNYPQALAAFQKGLEIARQLKYQEDYFNQKIQQILQPSSNYN